MWFVPSHVFDRMISMFLVQLNRGKVALVRTSDGRRDESGLHQIDNELYTFFSISVALQVRGLGCTSTANYCNFNYDLLGQLKASLVTDPR